MGQHEIYTLLKNKRLSGDHSYFTAIQICRILNGKGISINVSSINNSLSQLRRFGFLDMKIESKKPKRITYPIMCYRLKIEYST